MSEPEYFLYVYDVVGLSYSIIIHTKYIAIGGIKLVKKIGEKSYHKGYYIIDKHKPKMIIPTKTIISDLLEYDNTDDFLSDLCGLIKNNIDNFRYMCIELDKTQFINEVLYNECSHYANIPVKYFK